MHDDEVLGRAYDARLMRRIWAVARPHRRLMALSPARSSRCAAGLELLQPYLVKLAIDDYILAARLGRASAASPRSSRPRSSRSTGCAWPRPYLTQLTGQRVIHDLRATLFAHLQRRTRASSTGTRWAG